MIEVAFDIQVNEDNSPDSTWLDPTEMAMMLDHTKATIERQVIRKLSKLDIPQEQQPLRVVVSGEYSLETEQMELAYHIQTDDKHLLLRAVSALNH